VADLPGPSGSDYAEISCGGNACMAVGAAVRDDVSPPLASTYTWPGS
jgi:hypothetical protein